jgi:autotransporter-associated beta strand protein
VFSGSIKDEVSEGGSGTLKKVGSGTLTLSSGNTYEGGTVIWGGGIVVNNTTGSATGRGVVDVKMGTLGGGGFIAGAVTIGTGRGSGAILDPASANSPRTLTIQNHLILHADATCSVLINSDTPASDQVVARGIRIRNASVSFQDVGTALLPSGTTFTIINNTAPLRIKGTFSNLSDGSTFTVGRNTFQVNYEGGDGNDLTLTVVP